MRNLFALLARTHRWLRFIKFWGIELGWMNTTYSHHRTALSGWSMRMTGSWINTAGDLQEWTQLEASNARIMLENARLRPNSNLSKSNVPIHGNPAVQVCFEALGGEGPPGWSSTVVGKMARHPARASSPWDMRLASLWTPQRMRVWC